MAAPFCAQKLEKIPTDGQHSLGVEDPCSLPVAVGVEEGISIAEGRTSRCKGLRNVREGHWLAGFQAVSHG